MAAAGSGGKALAMKTGRREKKAEDAASSDRIQGQAFTLAHTRFRAERMEERVLSLSLSLCLLAAFFLGTS